MLSIVASIIAIIITGSVFYAMGYTPNIFIGYLVVIICMYIYLSSKKITTALFKIIVLVTIVSILGYWNYGKKEGYCVGPVKKIADAITSRECQNMCENNGDCRFSQVPLGTSKSGKRTLCEHTYGTDQKQWGNEKECGDTWENLLYVGPTIKNGSFTYNISKSEFAHKSNDHWYRCSGSGMTYRFYEDPYLSQKQKTKINNTWPGKPPSYYACVQGCDSGWCAKKSSNGFWNGNDFKIYKEMKTITFDKPLAVFYINLSIRTTTRKDWVFYVVATNSKTKQTHWQLDGQTLRMDGNVNRIKFDKKIPLEQMKKVDTIKFYVSNAFFRHALDNILAENITIEYSIKGKENSSNIPDPRNNFEHICSDDGQTFQIYNEPTLTESQREIMKRKYGSARPSEYACVQGCATTCRKTQKPSILAT